MSMNRRDWLKHTTTAALLVGTTGLRASQAALAPDLIRKKIPKSGELLPAIGVGTARRYQDASTAKEMEILGATLSVFTKAGGSVIDTAPSYGNAEAVTGELIEKLSLRDSIFISTKVGKTGREAGREEIEQSFKHLRTGKIDLISVHNLRDVDTQLKTLRELKDQGRIRYVGITTSFEGQHAETTALLKREPLDFVQVDYALDNRAAARTVLPTALERGVAVMVNLPFGRSSVFKAVQGKSLPAWAADFDAQTWAQFFLKYLISHEAVTVAIPGTATPDYAADNAAAMRGRLPNAAQRKQMEAFIDAL